MSFFHFDVYSDFFTPQEFPVEILNVAKKHDVVGCCLPPPAKNFLSFMLFKEFYYQSNGISVYVQDENDMDLLGSSKGKEKIGESPSTKAKNIGFPFEILTSLPTTHIKSAKEYKDKCVSCSSVIICSRNTFLELISDESPNFDQSFIENLNLVVIANVHEVLTRVEVRSSLRNILNRIRSWNQKRLTTIETKETIRLVFLSISLLHYYGNEATGFWRMEETFRKLEKFCEAKVDATSDIVALLRYSNPPTERIIPVGPHLHSEVSVKLIQEAKNMIDHFKIFLNSHNFNPAASLGYTLNEFQELIKEKPPAINVDCDDEDGDDDSLADELRRIPHPKTAPLAVLREFELILDSMGPWCASRAIFLLNNKVVGLKVQVPYVRHYLLLGALHTRLIWMQGIFNQAFDELEPLEVLENFSTPKLVGILNILRRFDLTTPHESKSQPLPVEENEDESEGELTVADYLEQQKQAEQQAVAARGGRYHGRRRHYKTRFDTDRHKNKLVKGVDKLDSEEVKPDKDQKNLSPNRTSIEPEDTTTEANQENGIELVSTVANATHSMSISMQGKEKIPNGCLERRIGDNEKSNHTQSARVQRRTRFAKAEDTLCGLLLCEDRFSARLLYHFLKEAAETDAKLVGLSPTIAIPLNPEYDKESKEAEIEYKKREESLRQFRYREANFLIGTSLLEDGVELPKANLVIRFDESTSFRSYLFSKGRAQGFDAEYYIFTEEPDRSKSLRQLATYKIVEETLLSHTVISKPTAAIPWTNEMELELIRKFPQFKSASLANSISTINRYCARLPSDTFTRLTPAWTLSEIERDSEKLYSCSLRLPINSPVKWPITGIPMPTDKLAKRAVALQTVFVLHSNSELDDMLMPVGKEGVTQEPDLCIGDDSVEDVYGEFRPGSTRRRQYYDKQLSPELIHCLPSSSKPLFLYWLKMVLTCPLPEDQNTRGRKLHPPEVASQSFGILLSKEMPPIPSFPIYTRCGEVHVELVQVTDDPSLYPMSTEKLSKLSTFHHYAFTSVLRLDKYLTLFDPEASENSYFVVPLKAIGKRWEDTPINSVQLDWDFVDRIWKEKDVLRPSGLPEKERKTYQFQREEYIDAVVTPWYRNNDQPQFFYVAEICVNLTPRSQFPGCEFKTFEEYYNRKYNLSIQDAQQPLLDVDHTSARLNFLTPRYVNRKGMALPTSSETTKRAKRENLEQKQILVPELCSIHPFSASLWRQAVCLPCILYRVNSLLLANTIRSVVATQVRGLGVIRVPDDFKWEPLSFGWSLQEVFGMSNNEDTKVTKSAKVKEPLPVKGVPEEFILKDEVVSPSNPTATESSEISTPTIEKPPEILKPAKVPEEKKQKELSGFEKAAKEEKPAGVTLAESLLLNDKKHAGKSLNEILNEEMKKCRQPELEIGTWTNEMASGVTYSEPEYDEDEDELLDPNVALPSNLMMLDKNWTWGGRSKLFNHKVHRALYGSPTHWGEVWDRGAFEPPEDLDNPKRGGGNDDDNMSVNSDLSGSDDGSYLDGDNNLKIQFEGNTAEAMDKRKFGEGFDYRPSDDWATSEDLWWTMDECGSSGESKCDTLDEDVELKTSFEKETALREEFERRVDDRIKGIHHIVNWNEITKLPPRATRKQIVQEETQHEADVFYAELLEKTPINPPIEFDQDLGTEKEKLSNEHQNYLQVSSINSTSFSFDYNPALKEHCGPSPCQILQALTMSNANDGQNLERLETIGDSFLKYAITSYLFCTYESIHEGKLSHLRSKQVSNVHLYRLGRRRGLGGVMVSAKFEPHDNWLPPGYHIPKDLDKALIQSQIELGTGNFSMAQVNALKGLSSSEIEHALKNNTLKMDTEFIPYNLVTQQSIPDKSIADCVEALIGAYLTSAGPYGALLFMSWLGMRVLPSTVIHKDQLPDNSDTSDSIFYMTIPPTEDVILFSVLKPPKSPLLKYSQTCQTQLETLLKGYDKFEEFIEYKFRDRSYLLQAFTHASYTPNTLTDCYQRLEFLGDAILDYLITRHLYEDKRQHSPGSLTDLRSALVNNTIFASLAVKNGFHMYFRHSSPGLATVLQKFVTFQEQHAHTLTQDYYLMGEEECEEAEDIEVPKALGDVFESVAGAIFLDSGMSLDAVWGVYYKIMKSEIEQFSQNVPKSPIRELLELEPETAKFGKPEKLWDGRRVRVTVEIFGVGTFRGIGRNYRIAKCTAAKCALRHLRRLRRTHVR